jgi:sortase A
MKKDAMKKITVTRWLLLIVGVSCLTLYSYTFLERVGSQAYAAWTFERDARHPSPLVAPGVAPGRSGAPQPLPGGTIVGRIWIPKIRLSAMVREGDNAKTLRRAVGHISATPLPGQPGNVGVAAHRDTFFRRLGDLHTGDNIGFSTMDGEFTYQVESLRVVDPEDVEVLASSPSPQEKVLTMVTCYPFFYIGNAPKRFIVRAKQVAGPGN